MGKLIDVDELRKYIGLSERCEDCDRDKTACQYDQVFTRMDFCGWLDDAPEAVVRCGNCKYWERKHVCYQWAEHGNETGSDDYCAFGERRPDE